MVESSPSPVRALGQADRVLTVTWPTRVGTQAEHVTAKFEFPSVLLPVAVVEGESIPMRWVVVQPGRARWPIQVLVVVLEDELAHVTLPHARLHQRTHGHDVEWVQKHGDLRRPAM